MYHQKLTNSPGAVRANGMPLDGVGRAKIVVSLELFSAEEEFTVIRNLTVDCLLHTDFLKEHGAVMDCHSSTLSIRKCLQCHVPMLMGHQQAKIDSVVVIALVDIEIPGRMIQLIQGELKEEYSSFCEALVEPMSGVPPSNFVYCKDTESSYVKKGGHTTGDECHPHNKNHLQGYEAWRGNPQTQCDAGG